MYTNDMARKDCQTARRVLKKAPEKNRPPGVGIAIRLAFLCWFVALATLLIFVITTLPQQKQNFINNLESKATSVAISLHEVAAGAAVNEDLASVVSACQTLLNGDATIEFIIVLKNDGFSLINEQNGWQVEPEALDYWLPKKRKSFSKITVVPDFNKRVFHFGQPFDYSGIKWGWIHVGLSLKSYDQSVSKLYANTIILALICAVLSLVVSLIYANKLVQPILRLRKTVQKIASGDLSVKANIYRKDELGSLAGSVNIMTDALRRRDRILESVRFSAQQMTQAEKWQEEIPLVLEKVGRAAGVSRVYIFQNHSNDQGHGHISQRYEWVAHGIRPQMSNPDLKNLSYEDSGFERWQKVLAADEIIIGPVHMLPENEQDLLKSQDILSIMVIPIFTETTWWGFMGFDDCRGERVWSDAEKDSLRAVADMLGATINRQQIQEDLIIAKNEAEQASRSKSEFLANMSHELRTPLNHIIGFTDLVLSRNFGELRDEQAEFLGDVLSSSHHLLSLINDVLDLSKVEAGKMELMLAPVNIRELLENSIVMIKEKALKHQLSVSINLDGIPEIIIADERKIKQVVYNLLSNAVKFTPDLGNISIGASAKAASALPLTEKQSALSEKWLSIWISDTGIGIEAADLERIFDPFEQVEGSASRKFQGTGLGLALTQKIVMMHGGSIWAESPGPDQGTIFRFILPLDGVLTETKTYRIIG